MILQNMDGVKMKERRYKIKWEHVKNARAPESPLVVSTKLPTLRASRNIGPTLSLKKFFLPCSVQYYLSRHIILK
jgi:hypothetical protein